MRFKTVVAAFFLLLICSNVTAADDYVQLPGAVQVYSTVSSGLYAIEDLAAMAKEKGLKVVILTDQGLMALEYGSFPLRNLVKKRIEKKSVLKLGPERYLAMIAQINNRQKDVLIVPGIQASPFYYWTGSSFKGNLTAHDYRKELLVIGLRAAEDYHHLPLMHRGFSTRYVRELLPQSIILLLAFLLGIYLVLQPGIFRLAGLLISISSLILMLDHHPFQSSRFDPYHGDQGIAPFQELIDYVQKRGGLTFWAHPELNYSMAGKVDQINLVTAPYIESLTEARGYTGFSALYNETVTIAEPGKKWDQLLNRYCRGERSKPVWGIAGANFRGVAGGIEIDSFQTVFLVRKQTETEILEALSKGRMYARRKGEKAALILGKFIVIDQESRRAAGSGGELHLGSRPEVSGELVASDGGKYTVTVSLIKGGKTVHTVAGETPMSFNFKDRDFLAGKTYYRLSVQGAQVGRLISNPIFIEKKAGDASLKAKAALPGKDRSLDTKAAPVEGQTKPAPPARSAGQRAAHYPYAIQVASFPNFDTAVQTLKSYRSKGLPTYYVKVDLGKKGVWWRIYGGHFKTRQAADQARRKYQMLESMVRRTAYANLISVFNSEEEFGEMRRRLDKSGFSPYVIKDRQDRLRLYVGAFITLKGAEAQKTELEKKGFQSRVVER